MKLERTERELFEALSGIEVIDAHEHLVPEARRVARKVDFFILFSHYGISVGKVYGHLIMAKEVVAKALGKRIRAEEMDMQDALRIAKRWFHDNAVRIYGL